MTRKWSLTLALAAVAIALPGCATKKYVQQEVSHQADKIQSVESAVEQNQRRIKEVDGEVDMVDGKAARAQETGDQAMERGNAAFKSAEEAMRLSKGKLIVEETFTNETTQFEVNKSDLPEGGIRALDELAQKVLNMNRRIYLEIQGHTDASGSEKWNMELGGQRAGAVRRYLNQRGVPLFAMSVISYGESKPVADNSSKEGRSQNRRVVVRVLE